MKFVYNLKFNGSFKLYRYRIKIHQIESEINNLARTGEKVRIVSCTNRRWKTTG